MTLPKTKHRPRTTLKGFTLIELLLVGAVLAVLATIFVANFSGSQRRARDAQRRSDIRQYQTGLEVYANNNNGNYPTVGTIAALCTSLAFPACPNDPQGTNPYGYSASASQYVLWARLEAPEGSPSAPVYFVTCSNGRSGTRPQSGWSNPSGGTCPL